MAYTRRSSPMEGFESDSTFFFVRLNKCNMTRLISQTWQCDPALSHIFAGAVRLAGFTWLVALQEEELARAFFGLDYCGKRRGIGKYSSAETRVWKGGVM